MRTDYAAIGQHVHVVIEADAIAQVWSSTATITKEVWKLKFYGYVPIPFRPNTVHYTVHLMYGQPLLQIPRFS